MFNFLAGLGTTFAGGILIVGANWKTLVNEAASSYTSDEIVTYSVGLPPQIGVPLNLLGCATFIGGTGFFGYRFLRELDPVFNQMAATPMPLDRPLQVRVSPGSVKGKPTASEVQHDESADRSQPQPTSGSISPDEWEQPTPSVTPRSPIAPEEKQPPVADEWEPAPKIVVNRYPRPNADIEVTKVPEEINILDVAARTELHLLFATKSGAGKTTTLKALIVKINEYLKGKVLFFLIDPKKRNWLGLEKVDNTYFTTNNRVVTSPAVVYPLGTNLLPAYQQIENVYNILVNRISQGEGVTFEHVYLIVDEWVALYDAISSEKKDICDRVMGMVKYILTMGREPNVHLILVGQSHSVADCGFSTKLRRCFTVLCQGRVGKNNDVGYDPIEAAIDDRYLITARTAEKLYPQLQEAIARAAEENDRPVILSTMGSCRIGLVEDFTGLLNDQIIFSNSLPSDTSYCEPEDGEPLPSDVNYYQSEEYKKSLELTRQFNEYIQRNKKDEDFGAE